jgi:hypothetical protein
LPDSALLAPHRATIGFVAGRGRQPDGTGPTMWAERLGFDCCSQLIAEPPVSAGLKTLPQIDQTFRLQLVTVRPQHLHQPNAGRRRRLALRLSTNHVNLLHMADGREGGPVPGV